MLWQYCLLFSLQTKTKTPPKANKKKGKKRASFCEGEFSSFRCYHFP